MHHADAQFHGFLGVVDIDRLTVHFDGAFKAARVVDYRHTEQNIHQRGFTGTVFPHEGVDFTGTHAEMDALEYLVAKVRLGDVVHL